MAEQSKGVALRTRKAKRWCLAARLQEQSFSKQRMELLDKGGQQMAIIIESQHQESQNSISRNVNQSQLGNQKGNQEALSQKTQMSGIQKKGRFSPREQKIITNAVGQFLAVNQIKYEDFLVILNEKNIFNTILKKANFYNIVSKNLPGRSVRSCCRFLKRNFNVRNRKGKWTQQEEHKFLRLVESGQSWHEISKIMDRSMQNVQDKYKNMLVEGNKKDSRWKLREFIQLLLLVNSRVSQPFLDLAIKEERQRQNIQNAREIISSRRFKYNTHQNVQPLIQLAMKYVSASIRRINLQQIGWTRISEKIKGRSMIECKNKFMQLLEYSIKSTRFDDLVIVQFLEKEGREDQEGVDWNQWSHAGMGWMEAKNRMIVLKKMVKNRGNLPFNQFISELKIKLASKVKQRV